jgi:hypothetical protein
MLQKMYSCRFIRVVISKALFYNIKYTSKEKKRKLLGLELHNW